MCFLPRLTALILSASLISGTALAQKGPDSPGGFSLTPYIGVLFPTKALLQRLSPTDSPAEAPLKLAVAVTGGLRLGVGLGDRIAIDADVGYSPGSLEVESRNVNANQDVQVLTGTGRVTLFLLPRASPIWFAVSGSGGAIRHTFSKNPSRPINDIKAGTNVGGVLGASAGFRIGRLLAVVVSAEDYLYNASFEINGTKTSERKQHDIRISTGLHIPFLGI